MPFRVSIFPVLLLPTGILKLGFQKSGERRGHRRCHRSHSDLSSANAFGLFAELEDPHEESAKKSNSFMNS